MFFVFTFCWKLSGNVTSVVVNNPPPSPAYSLNNNHIKMLDIYNVHQWNSIYNHWFWQIHWTPLLWTQVMTDSSGQISIRNPPVASTQYTKAISAGSSRKQVHTKVLITSGSRIEIWPVISTRCSLFAVMSTLCVIIPCHA